MDNIIYYLEKTPLGDEIHFDRNLILDLLYNKYITNDIVIYCYIDRLFLYTNIFKNLYYYDDKPNLEEIKMICNNKFNKNFSIIKYYDLCFHWSYDFFNKFGGFENMLNKTICITKPNIFNFKKLNYYNKSNYSNEFKNLVTNIQYLIELPKFNNEKYIVYHHRIKNDGCWDQNNNILDLILKYNKYNIVIFSQKKFNYNNDKIYTTSNLQEYASFIHNDNCLSIISVWSGEGQLASYCSNNKLIMYFDPCQLQYNIGNNRLNNYIKSENAWDFCSFTNNQRFFIDIKDLSNLESLIEK